jgi:hypothetical protein
MSQECSRPSEKYGHDTDSKTSPSLLTTDLGEFETPMDSSEERENDGTVSDLDVLDSV